MLSQFGLKNCQKIHLTLRSKGWYMPCILGLHTVNYFGTFPFICILFCPSSIPFFGSRWANERSLDKSTSWHLFDIPIIIIIIIIIIAVVVVVVVVISLSLFGRKHDIFSKATTCMHTYTYVCVCVPLSLSLSLCVKENGYSQNCTCVQKISPQKRSLDFENALESHTHTHTHIYIYIYI